MNKELIKQFVTRTDPVILEVGAHLGEDSVNFVTMYPYLNLFLFEPDARCVKAIKSLRLPGFLFEGVLSDVDGFIDFHASEGIGAEAGHWEGSGSIMEPLLHKEVFTQVGFMDVHKVPSVRLDTFVIQHGINEIDFIWMDVQGAEERVLTGGLDIFKNKVRGLFTEYSNVELYKGGTSKERILELLPSFRIVEDYPGGVCGDMLLANTNFEVKSNA